MILSRYLILLLLCYLPFYIFPIHAQSDNTLLFREDFKEIPASIPVTQEHIDNSELKLHLYGAAKDQLKKSNHPEIPNDPYYIWSGTCEGNWAMALSWLDKPIDLSSGGKIRWRSRQSGYRQLRILLQLNDDSWIISDDHVGETKDWEISEFQVPELNWRSFDMVNIIEGKRVLSPDLSKVLKIGISDVMVGGGTPASSRLDWIEVYGK